MSSVNVISAIFGGLSSGVFLIISLSFIFLDFAVYFILSLCLIDFGYKKRIFYVFIALSIIILFFAVCCFYKDSEFYVLFLIGEAILFSVPIFAVPVKRKDISYKEDKELIDFIDSEIQKPFDDAKGKDFSDFQEIGKKEGKDVELDFSHVKSVIERLGYYDLNREDKNEVRELSEYLFRAEKDGVSEELKPKINDGLSSLLKIMSKYGV